MVKNFHKVMVMCIDMCMVTLGNVIYKKARYTESPN